MAKDIPADSAEPETAAPVAAVPKRRPSPKVIAAAAVALLAVGGGAWFFLGRAPSPPAAEADAAAEAPAEPAAEAADTRPPQYLSLSPAFVVNLADDEAMRYLQVDIEVMARDAKTLESVKAHLPVIRNNLLLLMGQQRYQDLDTREGKEKLQAAALAEVQRILQEQTGQPGVEALYFTSLVMQ